MKHQLSCQTDRARLAWGRLTSAVPRQCLFIATTNSDRYLKDPTGNRRFHPVTVGAINLDALKRDRDQLWAEAYRRAQGGELADLPKDLWSAATEAQEARRVIGAFEERLGELVDGVTGIVIKETLWGALGRPDAAQRTQTEMNSLTETMRRLGWKPDRIRPQGNKDKVPVYVKAGPGLAPEWLVLHEGKFMHEAQRTFHMRGAGF